MKQQEQVKDKMAERMKELADEAKRVKMMTDAQRKKYYHDKAHANDHLNEFKKKGKMHQHNTKPKVMTAEQTFHL